ncbi:phosphoesterase [Caldimicrobium thiodismutans]|uniref:Phosphoesterase n=1 Tax=Caldimicrobium thiodismutans TaxID=1653476 RepID=A0A0U5AEK7_9BACT|nr:bifunctional oligoribonuclease/PAP phosphatase NrnA [Caldimicrobium thiodismutans]BAU22439.1 phosphoesterase [Caldimicrobium thiodismutans]
MLIEPIFQAIDSAQRIVLVTHQNPDVDGIASMLAFTLAFPEKNCLPLVEELPSNALFLKGIEKLRGPEDIKNSLDMDLLVIFDAQCEKRIPEDIRTKLKPKEVLIFDHHQREECETFQVSSPILCINPEEASTTVLIFRVLKALNIKITPDIAENLLAGLYYDTGGFRYENVKGDIFKVAQELLDYGARPSYIARELFENIPFSQIEALKSLLQKLTFLKDKTIAFSYLTFEELKALGGEKALNDLAGFMRSIRGVKISAFIKESKPKVIKVSLRSKAPVEVLPLAKRYGGGGHRFACGFTVNNISLEDFLKDFQKTLEEYL